MFQGHFNLLSNYETNNYYSLNYFFLLLYL